MNKIYHWSISKATEEWESLLLEEDSHDFDYEGIIPYDNSKGFLTPDKAFKKGLKRLKSNDYKEDVFMLEVYSGVEYESSYKALSINGKIQEI